MLIIIAHEETCDIVANGPTVDTRIRRQYVVVEPRVCTCGGVQFQISRTWDGWDIHPIQHQRDIDPVADVGVDDYDLARLILEAKQSDA